MDEITWFAPDRPVEGTVNVRRDVEPPDTPDDAQGNPAPPPNV